MSSPEVPGAPGWTAIDQALAVVYPGVEPLHFAATPPASAGGEDPLNGVSVFASTHGGRRHWHFVTYGFTELFGKETDEPAVSGYGFELTMRVIDPEAAAHRPPAWVFSLLQNLARYVFRTGNAFGPGHHMTANGPIALQRKTALTALAFVEDPQLPLQTTPNGQMIFLQVVGLTGDEYAVIKDWDTLAFFDLLRAKDRALVTDLGRDSYLADPAFRAACEQGQARDGASMQEVYASQGSFEDDGARAVFVVAANCVTDLHRLIAGRLAHGKPATYVWPDGLLCLEGAADTEVIAAEGIATLRLSARDQAAIAAIPVARGDYPLPSGRALVRVVPIDIYDPTRTKVIDTVG